MPPNRCGNCHACCLFCGEPPFATEEEYDNLPAFLQNELLEYYTDLYASGLSARGVYRLPCLWLDVESGFCQHYDYRPLICSNFEIGGTECRFFINKVYGYDTIFVYSNLYIEGSS